jgi:hypothetical protein
MDTYGVKLSRTETEACQLLVSVGSISTGDILHLMKENKFTIAVCKWLHSYLLDVEEGITGDKSFAFLMVNKGKTCIGYALGEHKRKDERWYDKSDTTMFFLEKEMYDKLTGKDYGVFIERVPNESRDEYVSDVYMYRNKSYASNEVTFRPDAFEPASCMANYTEVKVVGAWTVCKREAKTAGSSSTSGGTVYTKEQLALIGEFKEEYGVDLKDGCNFTIEEEDAKTNVTIYPSDDAAFDQPMMPVLDAWMDDGDLGKFIELVPTNFEFEGTRYELAALMKKYEPFFAAATDEDAAEATAEEVEDYHEEDDESFGDSAPERLRKKPEAAAPEKELTADKFFVSVVEKDGGEKYAAIVIKSYWNANRHLADESPEVPKKLLEAADLCKTPLFDSIWEFNDTSAFKSTDELTEQLTAVGFGTNEKFDEFIKSL